MIALDVHLTLDKDVVLVRQDVGVTVMLENTGKAGLVVPLAALDPSVPVVRLLNMDSGAERVCSRPTERSGVGGLPPGELPPGESVTSFFSLLDVTGVLEPGHYELSVDWACQSAGAPERSVRSAPVDIEVLPSSPRAVTLVDQFGGVSSESWAAWVDLGANEPWIVRGRVSTAAGGGVDRIERVAPCPADIEPILSAPRPSEHLPCHWIAWVQGGALSCLHVDGELGVSKPQQARLLPGSRIVGPIHSEAFEDTRVRPGGGALVVVPGGAKRFGLQSFGFSERGTKPGGMAPIDGPLPAWIRSHVRAKGEHLAVFAQTNESEVTLSVVPWPGIARAVTVRATRLGQWTASLVGGASRLDREGVIRGCLALWLVVDNEWRLALQPWALSRQGEFEQGEPLFIDKWAFDRPIVRHVVAVDDLGRPGALLRDDEGWWAVSVGGELSAVGGALTGCEMALALGFLGGDGEEILVGGVREGGLVLQTTSGGPLPARMK